jgi:hypothetical protein
MGKMAQLSAAGAVVMAEVNDEKVEEIVELTSAMAEELGGRGDDHVGGGHRRHCGIDGREGEEITDEMGNLILPSLEGHLQAEVSQRAREIGQGIECSKKRTCLVDSNSKRLFLAMAIAKVPRVPSQI